MKFKTNRGGFHIIGKKYTLSIQIGYGTYSDNHDIPLDGIEWTKKATFESELAEIAIWKNPKVEGGNTRWVLKEQVKGYVEVEEVMKLLAKMFEEEYK